MKKRKPKINTFQRRVLVFLFALVFIPSTIGSSFTFWYGYQRDIKQQKIMDRKTAVLISSYISRKIESYCSYLKYDIKDDIEISEGNLVSQKKEISPLWNEQFNKNFPYIDNIFYLSKDFSARNFQSKPSKRVLSYLKYNLHKYKGSTKKTIYLTPIQETDDRLLLFLILSNTKLIKDKLDGSFQSNYLISVVDIQKLLNNEFIPYLRTNNKTKIFLKDSFGKIVDIDFEKINPSSQNVLEKYTCKIHLDKSPHYLNQLINNDNIVKGDLEFGKTFGIKSSIPWSIYVYTSTDNMIMNSISMVLEITWIGFVFALLLGIVASFYFKKKIIGPIKSLKTEIDSFMESKDESVIFKHSMNCIIYPLSETFKSLINANKEKEEKIKQNVDNLEKQVGNRTREIKLKSKYYKNILDKLNVGVLVINQSHKILDENDYIRDNFGEGKEKCHERIYYDDNTCRGRMGVVALKAKKGKSNKFEMKDKRGRTFEVVHSKLEHNGEKFLIEILYDITELKKKERKLSDEKELFESLFNSITDPIALFGVDGTMFKSNEGARSLLSTNEKTNAFSDVNTGFTHIKSLLINETVRKRSSIVKTYSLPTSESKITTYPIFNIEKEVTKVIFYGVDITKERRLENLLFMSNQVAHEINNPLQTIRWKIDNINHNLQNRTDKEYFIKKNHEILNETERIVFIVKQLALLSKKNIEKKPADLIDIIEDSLRSVKELNPTVNIETTIDTGDQEDFAIMCDSHRLQSVFINLFQNSYHAFENNTKSPTISIKITEGRNGYYKIVFSDNGQGIPSEIRTKIFEPFFTTKDPEKGTGLGLSICYNFIKEHEGNISLADSNGKGTSFIVGLPKIVINKEGKGEIGYEYL